MNLATLKELTWQADNAEILARLKELARQADSTEIREILAALIQLVWQADSAEIGGKEVIFTYIKETMYDTLQKQYSLQELKEAFRCLKLNVVSVSYQISYKEKEEEETEVAFRDAHGAFYASGYGVLAWPAEQTQTLPKGIFAGEYHQCIFDDSKLDLNLEGSLLLKTRYFSPRKTVTAEPVSA